MQENLLFRSKQGNGQFPVSQKQGTGHFLVSQKQGTGHFPVSQKQGIGQFPVLNEMSIFFMHYIFDEKKLYVKFFPDN